MKYRIKVYQYLVNRTPVIQKRYHAIRQQRQGFCGRCYAWAALVWMNLAWIFCRKKWEENFYFEDARKKMPLGRSESSFSCRESPQSFAEYLKKHDVISFDIFDTLIFRPFAVPSDLFFVVGAKLKQPDFEYIRKNAEQIARRKAYETRGSYEVTLAEIYNELKWQAGIPPQKGMRVEIETETEMCFGNPYMLEVFRYLQGCGKEIICTSDMYLPLCVIKNIVEKCGFRGISKYFISCECNLSKARGDIYKTVKEYYGIQRKYVHVGDHPVSDVKMAKKQGFVTEFYPNVNIAGMPYRASDMSIITGSLYRGTVNAHIHNGQKAYSQGYELGFIYGGLFVAGYCQFIHKYVHTHEVDKILFLSRDGDILHQAYQRLYPEETERTAYVYWSRLAAAKLGAGYYKYDYFRRFIDHKINRGYTLQEIFDAMEIGDMLSKISDLSPTTKLTEQNAGIVKGYLMKHWEEVLAHYKEQLNAGRLYYEKILASCKHVVAVDIGWAGSGAIILDYIVNEIWQLDCKITGLIAGTNTIYNEAPNMGESQQSSGQLVSYLYSQAHNRMLWKWHDAAKGHNLGVELLCSSKEGSLIGFYPVTEKIGSDFLQKGQDTKGYHILLKKPDVDIKIVEEIQEGIRDFVDLAISHWEYIMADWKVSGSDAYAPLKIFLSDQKRLSEWIREIAVDI